MSRRIILVADYGAPYIGGMEVHAEECARHFEQRGDLAGVCLMPLADSADALPHFQKSISLHTPITELSRSSIFAPEELGNAFATYGVSTDTILFFNSLYWVRILGDLKQRFPTLKIFVRSGGNDIFQARAEGTGDTLEERQAYLVRQITLYADGLIVNSAFSQQRLASLGIPEERMHVVSGGVDISRFTPAIREEKDTIREALGLPENHIIILAACRLVPFKGMGQTLSILSRLRTQTPFLYLIVGDGPERASLEHHAHKVGIEKQVRFLGVVPHRTISDYFRAADVYGYFPKLETMHELGGMYVHTETMGRSFCEAMATALPIVSSRVGGIGEIVHSGAHGFLTENKNTGEEERALAQLIDDPLLRKQLGEQARQQAIKNYSWEAVCSSYLKIFSLCT